MVNHLWYLVPLWGHTMPGLVLIAQSLETNPDLEVTLVSHVKNSERPASTLLRNCVSRGRQGGGGGKGAL